MSHVESNSSPIWIIGYGNPQRRDDGIGAYVVAELNEILKGKQGIETLAVHQLGPDLVWDLRNAKLILFIDATMSELKEGWQWTIVEPELKNLPYLSHYFDPAFLLGLLQSIYVESPEAWMISVEGRDFDIGEGLTKEAQNRACMVAAEILKLLESDYLDQTAIPGIDSKGNKTKRLPSFQKKAN